MSADRRSPPDRLRELVVVLARHLARTKFKNVWPEAARRYEAWVITLSVDDGDLLLDFAHHPLELWHWQELLTQFRAECVAVAETIAIREKDGPLLERARTVSAGLRLRVAN